MLAEDDHILWCCNNLEWKIIATAPCGRMLSSQEKKVSEVRKRLNKREIECTKAGQYGHTHSQHMWEKSWHSGKSGKRRKIEADPSSQSQRDISHSNKCPSHAELLHPALISPGHFSLRGECVRGHEGVCVRAWALEVIDLRMRRLFGGVMACHKSDSFCHGIAVLHGHAHHRERPIWTEIRCAN